MQIFKINIKRMNINETYETSKQIIAFSNDILKFLAMNEEDRLAYINKSYKKIKRINSDGDVTDLNGNIIYHRYSKESVAFKILELKKEINKQEHLLGDKLIDSLGDKNE